MNKKRSPIKFTIILVFFILLVCFLWHVETRLTWKKDAIVSTINQPVVGRAFQGKLRIGAFNIAHGRGSVPSGSNWTGGNSEERSNRLDAIADLILTEDLDIVILNEVDFSSVWSGHIDQAQYISKRSKLHHVVKQTNYEASVPFFRIHFGNAILSRYPIFEASLLELPVLKSSENTLFGAKHGMVANILLRPDLFIHMLPVHLEARDEEVRKKSLKTLLSATGSERFLVGDFNMTPDSLEPLLPVHTGPTFPSSDPSRRIDWIFYPQNWRCTESRAIATDLSDHSFVVATFCLE